MFIKLSSLVTTLVKSLHKVTGDGDASRGERPVIQLNDHILTVHTPYLSTDKANTGLRSYG